MTVHTYDALWKVEKKLYSIGDIHLPMPIGYTKLLFYFVGLAIMVGLTYFLGILSWNQALLKYGVLPGVFAWGMMRIRFDGRGAYKYFYALFGWLLRPHLIRRYQPVQVGKKGYQYHCIVYQDMEVENEVEASGRNVKAKMASKKGKPFITFRQCSRKRKCKEQNQEPGAD